MEKSKPIDHKKIFELTDKLMNDQSITPEEEVQLLDVQIGLLELERHGHEKRFKMARFLALLTFIIGVIVFQKQLNASGDMYSAWKNFSNVWIYCWIWMIITYAYHRARFRVLTFVNAGLVAMLKMKQK